jgi:putative SOS response-associated peptidase YedK
VIGQPRNLQLRYNIAPTTPIEVIRAGRAGNGLVPMRWAVAPAWQKKPLNWLPPTFNARAETLSERPMFRGGLKYRRGIVPRAASMNGPGQRREYAALIHVARRPSAGVSWHMGPLEWLDGGDDLPNATIIVGAANEWMSTNHDRQPKILDWRDAAGTASKSSAQRCTSIRS